MRAAGIEHATAEFYAWEAHGRGTGVAMLPVQLEPEFKPFFFHSSPPRAYDDGHRHTVISKAIALLWKKPTIDPPEPQKYVVSFLPDTGEENFTTLRLTFPVGYSVAVGDAEQCLLLLGEYVPTLSFEIVATHELIAFQIACPEGVAKYVSAQLKAFFPMLTVTDIGEDGLELSDRYTMTIDFGLAEEFMRPSATPHREAQDPLIGIIGVLDHVAPGERVVLQTLFSKTVNDWTPSIINAVTDTNGEQFFLDAPEMLPLAKEKVKHPFFAATVRAVVQSDNPKRAHLLLAQLSTVITHASRSPYNRLVPLPVAGYSFEKRLDDIVLRQSHRGGMLLNSKELLLLVRFPSPAVHSKKLNRSVKKTKAAPHISSGIRLGINVHDGRETEVRIDDEDRYKHTHIIGSTGTGKSSLIMAMALQDIARGKGAMILDPHGDLIDGILARIPENRRDDVILIDPGNTEFPIGLNILNAEAANQDVLSADIVAVFRRLSSSWGDQMNSVLSNAILSFLENTQQGTLIDLRRFLIEKPFRDKWLKTVTDPSIAYYWSHEYPLLKSSSIGPILTKLDTFLRPKQIRFMVSQQKMLDFAAVIAKKKVVLAKLSQGLIGAENSYLLGTLLVSKVHQAILAQQAKDATARTDFFLYIDEFQHFITPSMATMLSGVRKYKLGLILAHQDLHQLQKYDAELANSVLTNTYTRICFRLAENDAKKMQEGFSSFAAADFQNLETGEAIARIGRPDNDFTLTTTLRENSGSSDSIDYITSQSQQLYGTKRSEVESYISENLQSAKEYTPTTIPITPHRKQAPPDSTLPSQAPTQKVDETVIAKRANQYTQSLHRHLQNLVKKIAEDYGYTATVEAPLSDGSGRVDVSLERGGERIACEISVTTEAAWEVHNIEKCLSDGYNKVWCCAPDEKLLQQLKKKVGVLLPEALKHKVIFVEPRTIFSLLSPSAHQQEETVIKGRRVTTTYTNLSPDEVGQKQSMIRKVAADALRKSKTKKG